jgi:hypothetical protein
VTFAPALAPQINLFRHSGPARHRAAVDVQNGGYLPGPGLSGFMAVVGERFVKEEGSCDRCIEGVADA